MSNLVKTAIISLVLIVCSSNDLYIYSNTDKCKISEYFDIKNFKCIKCDPKKNLVPTDNKLQCKCNSSVVMTSTWETTQASPLCKSCPEGMIISHGNTCVLENCTVIKTNGSKNLIRVCQKCGPEEIEVTHHINGSLLNTMTCIKCSPGYKPSHDKSICRRCDLRLLNGTKLIDVCQCPKKSHIELQNICIPETFNQWSYEVKYKDLTFSSQFLKEYLSTAAYYCSLKNSSSCQVLANMCALVLYSDHNGSPCTPWVVHRDQRSSAINAGIAGNDLPGIMFEEGDAHALLYRKKIPIEYTITDNKLSSKKNKLNFTLISYSLLGEQIAIKHIEINFFNLCPISPITLNSMRRFGQTFHYECKIPSKQLLESKETEFMELFLQYYEGAESLLYSVPILIKNMGRHSDNHGRDMSSWILVKRFFNIDKLSNNLKKSNNMGLGITRYINSIEFTIRIQEGTNGKIYPPLMTIEYGIITPAELENNVLLPFKISAKYIIDSNLITAIQISTVVLCSIAVLYSAIQSWSYSRRSGNVTIDISTVLRFLLFCAGNIGSSLYIVGASTCICQYLIVQTQSELLHFMPNKTEENLIRGIIVIAFPLKMIHITQFLYYQCNIDIFFIDWEKPKALDCLPRPTSLTASSSLSRYSQSTVPLISIWRTYLVANEWNELQCMRKINLTYHIIAMLIIVEALDWDNHRIKYLATGSQYERPSALLAQGVLIYMGLYLLQLVLYLGIYERFVQSPIQGFVDICSLANISVFILALEQYGFYIHGRSPHGFADTDMRSMTAQLQREQEGRCATRGLLRDSQQQTFSVRVPYSLRSYYKKMMQPLQLEKRARPSIMRSGDFDSENNEKNVQAYHSINKFLALFIDHALRDLDYEVRSRQIVEWLLDSEFQDGLTSPERGTFLSDSGHSFDGALWYGNETKFLFLELSLFSSVIILHGSYILAILLVAVLNKMLIMLTRIFSKRNIARKTLIDERFLI